MRILASHSPGEVRVALLDGDDRLLEAWVERAGAPDGVGDLHRARVTAIAPAMHGAFVALGGGEAGFLPEKDVPGAPGELRLQEGRVFPVRVSRAAQGGKGLRVSARLDPEETARAAAAAKSPEATGAAPRRLAHGPDAVLRLARGHPDAPVETDGAGVAARLRAALGPDRVLFRPGAAPVFDDALETEWEALAGPQAQLPGGGRVLVQPTAALTAIDVDAGSIGGGRDRSAQMRFNAEAVAEAARQIRLRNLAGAVLLDVAGLSRRERERLSQPLARALAADPLVRFLGLGPLGLFEMQRRRVHPPLHEVFGWPLSPLTLGLAALRRAAREVAAAPGRRSLTLRAAPSVATALAGAAEAMREMAAAAGRPLQLHADPALSPGQEVLEENPHGR